MASVKEKRKGEKIVSYRFSVCLGRDENGVQIRETKTWKPPKSMTPNKARKEAEKQAVLWEQSLKDAVEPKPITAQPTVETREDDFVEFVEKVWFPLRVSGNDRKAKTIQFYEGTTKMINAYFAGRTLQEITALDIEKYLVYLRTEYKSRYGKPLAHKTIHHHYGTLNLIFNYAEKQELITKNPMVKVDAPKKKRKKVDAFTQEQAKDFFKEIENCPLDFRCMLYLLITTGIRRGECVGLKWKDIDTRASTLSIKRSISYTPKDGLVVNTPKTENSIRTIPLIPSVLALLMEYKKQIARQERREDLSEAFVYDDLAAKYDALKEKVEKYSTVIDALEKEDYDGAVEAVNAMRPAPEVTAVEITMDNLWDYFEITEQRDEQTDAQGSIISVTINRILALKEEFNLADLVQYPTDVAVGYEYDKEEVQYWKPCTIDFDAFTCDGRVAWRFDVSHESKMIHFPQKGNLNSAWADYPAGGDVADITTCENLEILNASGTLYLVNK